MLLALCLKDLSRPYSSALVLNEAHPSLTNYWFLKSLFSPSKVLNFPFYCYNYLLLNIINLISKTPSINYNYSILEK